MSPNQRFVIIVLGFVSFFVLLVFASDLNTIVSNENMVSACVEEDKVSYLYRGKYICANSGDEVKELLIIQ